LRPSLTFNKSFHDRPRYDLDDQKIRQLREFSHSLGLLQPVATGNNRPIAVIRERPQLASNRRSIKECFCGQKRSLFRLLFGR